MTTGYTIPIEKGMVCAKSLIHISTVSTQKVARKINGVEFAKAKKFIEDLNNEKVSIDGKYFTRSTNEVFKLIKTLEANANAQSIDTESMKLFVSVSKGPSMYRGKRRNNFGHRLKMTHVQVVLKPFEKKKKEDKKDKVK